jgi:ATP-dependent HslUV protease subunit HslV
MMIVADKRDTLVITGTGDVLTPDHDTIAIGSGGNYAYASALAYIDSGADLPAVEIARRSLKIASGICIYTNSNITVEELA